VPARRIPPAVVEPVRALGAHPRVEPAVALALRARTVRESARFALRELAGPRRAARYTLRDGGLRVLIRHGTGDVVTLGEVFHRPDYAFPPEVARVLDAARPRPVVADLGANVGMFGLYLLGRWPEARLDAFEPDPANAAVLRRAVSLNGFGDRWAVHEAAAGARNGSVRFRSGGVALSRIDDEGDLEVPLVDVCDRLAGLDLLKMDIEGGEWEILADRRFGAPGPRAVVLEYHPHLCPSGDPGTALRERLEECGYAHRWLFDRGDGTGMAWAWKRP
jgi:FkbM family methyltransferase